MYLTDWDVVKLLKSAKEHLAKSEDYTEEGELKTGLIFVKENEDRQGFLVDRSNGYSLVRNLQYQQALFEEAGLEMVYHSNIENWPDYLLPVGCYVLRPKLTNYYNNFDL